MPFSLKHVNYILAVERTGSVTAAANQLFISQPAFIVRSSVRWNGSWARPFSTAVPPPCV